MMLHNLSRLLSLLCHVRVIGQTQLMATQPDQVIPNGHYLIHDLGCGGVIHISVYLSEYPTFFFTGSVAVLFVGP